MARAVSDQQLSREILKTVAAQLKKTDSKNSKARVSDHAGVPPLRERG